MFCATVLINKACMKTADTNQKKEKMSGHENYTDSTPEGSEWLQHKAPRWAPAAGSVTESQLRGPEMTATWKEGGQGSFVSPPHATTCQAADGEETTVIHSLFREVVITDQLRADSACEVSLHLAPGTHQSLSHVSPPTAVTRTAISFSILVGT